MRRVWLPLARAAGAGTTSSSTAIATAARAAVLTDSLQTRSYASSSSSSRRGGGGGSKSKLSVSARSTSPSSRQARSSDGPFRTTTGRRESGMPAISAAKMVSSMQQQKKRPGGKPSAREKAEVEAQLEALVARGRAPAFEPTLDFLRTASRVLQLCKTREQLTAALPLCTLVERAAILHGTATMECVRIYQRLGRNHEVVALAERLFAHDFFLMNPVLANAIQACSALGDVDKGFELFETAVERGTIPNLTVYSALLALCGTAGDTVRVQVVLAKMAAAGLEMTNITYHNLMSAYSKGGHGDEAIRLFTDLKDRGLVPDEHTYAILMDAYGESGAYDTALALFNELKRAGTVAPNLVHYNVMLKACGKASELTTAFQLYEEMKTKQIAPDLVTYITMMHAVFHGELGAVDTRKVKAALFGVGAIGAASVPFIDLEAHYLTVLFCSSLVGSMGLAAYMNPDGVLRTLYPNADEPRHDGVLDAFFRRLREEDHCGRSIYLWREMRKFGVAPDPRVYDVLVRTCVKKRHPELAFAAVFEEGLPLVTTSTNTVNGDGPSGAAGGSGGTFVLPLQTTVQFLQSLLAQRRTTMADTLFRAARDHGVFADVFDEDARRCVYDLRTFGSGAVRGYVVEQVLAELRAHVAAEAKIVDDVAVPDVEFLVLHGYELLDQLDADATGVRELFSMDDMRREAAGAGQYFFRLAVRGAALQQFFATTTGVKDARL